MFKGVPLKPLVLKLLQHAVYNVNVECEVCHTLCTVCSVFIVSDHECSDSECGSGSHLTHPSAQLRHPTPSEIEFCIRS